MKTYDYFQARWHKRRALRSKAKTKEALNQIDAALQNKTEGL